MEAVSSSTEAIASAEDIICTICQEDVKQDKCTLPDCVHVFHFECLSSFFRLGKDKWHCPNCRSKFSKVFRVDIDAWVAAFVDTVQQSESDSEEEDWEEESVDNQPCMVCGGHGDVLICDGCNEVCHLGCAGLTEVPEGEWYCTNCRATRQEPVSRALPRTRQNQVRPRSRRQNRIQRERVASSATQEVQASSEEESFAERVWFEITCSSVEEERKSTKYNVEVLTREMTAAMKNDRKRLEMMPKVARYICFQQVPSDLRRLFRSQFLNHVRGWFQLSFDSPAVHSRDERVFRYCLLKTVDLIKEQVTRADLRSSKINKLILECYRRDVDYNKRIAVPLFSTFCEALGNLGTSSQPQQQQLPTASTQTDRQLDMQPRSTAKRPKLIRRPAPASLS